MSSTIRTFIAIELDERLRRELIRIQDLLKKADADVKWMDAGNIHLTLKFLGDTPLDKIDTIKAALENTAADFSSFDIELAGLDSFPNTHAPRIIWAGVANGTDGLSAIATRLEEELEPLGFIKEDRGFSAHITLGRARSPDGKVRLSRALLETALTPGLTQRVSRLTFFQSTITSAGPIYSIIHQAKLQDKA